MVKRLGSVIYLNHDDRKLHIHVYRSGRVIEVEWPEGIDIAYGAVVDVHPNGTFTYPVANPCKHVGPDSGAPKRRRKMSNNALSLGISVPTTAGADITLKKLLFRCACPDCAAMGTTLLTLNHLMPTLVDGKKKDYCFDGFNKHTGSSLSKKQFKLSVIHHRTAEKVAVKFDDAMVHAPLENLIFNSYLAKKRKASGAGKRTFKKIGDEGYRKLVMDMIRQKVTDPTLDATLYAAQTMRDVVSIMVSARKAFGRARLATVMKSAEFMRVIFGSFLVLPWLIRGLWSALSAANSGG